MFVISRKHYIIWLDTIFIVLLFLSNNSFAKGKNSKEIEALLLEEKATASIAEGHSEGYEKAWLYTISALMASEQAKINLPISRGRIFSKKFRENAFQRTWFLPVIPCFKKIAFGLSSKVFCATDLVHSVFVYESNSGKLIKKIKIKEKIIDINVTASTDRLFIITNQHAMSYDLKNLDALNVLDKRETPNFIGSFTGDDGDIRIVFFDKDLKYLKLETGVTTDIPMASNDSAWRATRYFCGGSLLAQVTPDSISFFNVAEGKLKLTIKPTSNVINVVLSSHHAIIKYADTSIVIDINANEKIFEFKPKIDPIAVSDKILIRDEHDLQVIDLKGKEFGSQRAQMPEPNVFASPDFSCVIGISQDSMIRVHLNKGESYFVVGIPSNYRSVKFHKERDMIGISLPHTLLMWDIDSKKMHPPIYTADEVIDYNFLGGSVAIFERHEDSVLIDWELGKNLNYDIISGSDYSGTIRKFVIAKSGGLHLFETKDQKPFMTFPVPSPRDPMFSDDGKFIVFKNNSESHCLKLETMETINLSEHLKSLIGISQSAPLIAGYSPEGNLLVYDYSNNRTISKNNNIYASNGKFSTSNQYFITQDKNSFLLELESSCTTKNTQEVVDTAFNETDSDMFVFNGQQVNLYTARGTKLKNTYQNSLFKPAHDVNNMYTRDTFPTLLKKPFNNKLHLSKSGELITLFKDGISQWAVPINESFSSIQNMHFNKENTLIIESDRDIAQTHPVCGPIKRSKKRTPFNLDETALISGNGIDLRIPFKDLEPSDLEYDILEEHPNATLISHPKKNSFYIDKAGDIIHFNPRNGFKTTLMSYEDAQLIVNQSKDGDYVSFALGSTVRIYAENRLVSSFEMEDSVDALLFSPDSKNLAIVSNKRSLHLFSIPNNSKLAQVDNLKSNIIYLQYSPDSRFLSFATECGMIDILDFKNILNANELKFVMATSNRLLSLALDENYKITELNSFMETADLGMLLKDQSLEKGVIQYLLNK